MAKCNPPPVRFITSHPAQCTSPAVSAQHYHSWPLMPLQQTGPSCLLICLKDLPGAYQSAPPADYLSNWAETKAMNADSVGSDFFTGGGQQCAPSREKVSKCHLRYLLQGTTSKHAALSLAEPCSVFLTVVKENLIYFWWNLLFGQRAKGLCQKYSVDFCETEMIGSRRTHEILAQFWKKEQIQSFFLSCKYKLCCPISILFYTNRTAGCSCFVFNLCA